MAILASSPIILLETRFLVKMTEIVKILKIGIMEKTILIVDDEPHIRILIEQT
jgi:hypothetical protein